MADPARARKVADRIKVVVAEYLEHRVKDERLGFVTITDVRVTGDLQQATVFYTTYGTDLERQDTAAAIEAAKGRTRSAVGKALGIRLTPTLEFVPDALPEGASRLEDAILAVRAADEQLARSRTGAAYAGEADPYRKPVDETDDDGLGPVGDEAATDDDHPLAGDDDR